MKNLAKRFELVNLAIELKEYEIVDIEVKKLRTYSLAKDARNILDFISDKEYEKASFAINQYTKHLLEPNAYKDDKTYNLQLQLQTLEDDLCDTIDKKNECISQINLFNFMFEKHLGSTIGKILEKRREKARHDYRDGVISGREYDEIDETYKKFFDSEMSQVKASNAHLNEKEDEKLRELYSKIQKKINPDLVQDSFKERAQSIYNTLNIAYKKGDFTSMQNIYKNVQDHPNAIQKYDKVENKDLLRVQSKNLRQAISFHKSELEMLESSEAVAIINSADNLESYFLDLKKKLTQ